MTEVLLLPPGAPLDPVDGVFSTDGRLARGQRTRRRVAESLVALLEAGDEEPTARRIAESAGVSLRLVFHHFEDMEDLYRAVCELQYERHWRDLPSVSATLPLERRIERMTRLRAVLYEEVSPVRRAGLRRTGGSVALAELFRVSNERSRGDLAMTFAPELELLADREAQELLAALDATASWEFWERLRRVQGLAVSGARKVVARSMRALLTVPDPTDAD